MIGTRLCYAGRTLVFAALAEQTLPSHVVFRPDSKKARGMTLVIYKLPATRRLRMHVVVSVAAVPEQLQMSSQANVCRGVHQLHDLLTESDEG